MFALIAVTLVIVAVFVHDMWRTCRRTTAGRRAPKEDGESQD